MPDDDVRAGELNQRITLRSRDDVNAEDPTYTGTPIAENVPARKRALRGRELVASGRDVAESWVEWKLRYRDDITAAERLDHGSDQYDIEDVTDRTGNRRALYITSKRVI